VLVARYQVRLKNQAGVNVAIFDDWRSLQWQSVVNDKGFYSLTLDANDARLPLFEPDGQIEIWRSIPGNLAWSLAFEAHVEDAYDSLAENGNRQYVSVGSGYNGVLGRRTISAYSDTARANKSGTAETVMKAYVNENIGPGATFPARPMQSGVMTGLTVEADSAAGNTWTGQRGQQNLLETLKKIAIIGEVDFAVVGTGPATYEFRVYPDQLGIDRTTVGLDPATGLNAAGNIPVVFSPMLNNVRSMEHTIKYGDSFNAVFVWGQGVGSLRALRLRTDPVGVGVSPIGLREFSRSGGSQTTNANLDQMGDEDLEKYKARDELTFTPLLNEQTLYGVHFNVGDRVTSDYFGYISHKRIVGVKGDIASGSGGEQLAFDFADIP
jgi:hypothetical protein